mmetsp:Transcript_21177/g.37342  ORF Transcript_21177/g.37342 Transcript_21177/m.37342 type:complete len:127 (-) Transcript_21177:439-819(-)
MAGDANPSSEEPVVKAQQVVPNDVDKNLQEALAHAPTDANKVAPVEEAKKESKDQAISKKEDGFEVNPFHSALAAISIAILVAIVQQSDVLNGGSLNRWAESLFEEHVVQPPMAADNVCTVQFCQS